MKPFRFDATVLNPTSLSPDVRKSFETRLDTAGASDLRVNEDEEGRATVSFVLQAETERDALSKGSELTLSALSGFHDVRWVSSGITHWLDAP
jgi:hypothetical protein